MKSYIKYYHGIDPVEPIDEVEAEVTPVDVDPVDPDVDHIIHKDFLECGTYNHSKADWMRQEENRTQGYR